MYPTPVLTLPRCFPFVIVPFLIFFFFIRPASSSHPCNKMPNRRVKRHILAHGFTNFSPSLWGRHGSSEALVAHGSSGALEVCGEGDGKRK